jgi:hypothetical protein
VDCKFLCLHMQSACISLNSHVHGKLSSQHFVRMNCYILIYSPAKIAVMSSIYENCFCSIDNLSLTLAYHCRLKTANLDLCLVRMIFSNEGYFTCHNCCDTETSVFKVMVTSLYNRKILERDVKQQMN